MDDNIIADDTMIKQSEDLVREINKNCKIMKISTFKRIGIKEVANIIATQSSARYDEAVEKELLRQQYGA